MKEDDVPRAGAADGTGLRVLCVLGTRPEAIKMAPVVRALRDCADVEALVCVTGQHRELLDQTLAVLHIEPDFDLDLMQPGQDVVDLFGRLLTGIRHVIDRTRPHMVLVQGDTTSTVAAAMAAAYRGVAVGHVEAGLRTHDFTAPFPEEINRAVVDRVASVCFAPTATAARNLRREGVARERIFVTGNTVVDALLALGVPRRRRDTRERTVLVTCHRRETFGEPLRQVCEAVRTLVRRNPALRVQWVLHPNPEAGAVAAAALSHLTAVDLVPPLSYPAVLEAVARAHFVLTDSGGLQEEATVIGTPVLVLRRLTERTEGVAAGVAQLVGADHDTIVTAAQRLLDDDGLHRRMSRRLAVYGDGRAAERIVGWLRRHARLTEHCVAAFRGTRAASAVLAMAAMILTAGGCAGKPPVQVRNLAHAPQNAMPPIPAREISLGPGDEVEVFVWDHPDLTRRVRITQSGMLPYPLVGDFDVTGLTAGAVRDRLTRDLAEFVKSPHVSVSIVAVRSQKVYVFGEVVKPGVYTLESATTSLAEAIGQAGGLTLDAKRQKILVLRGNQQQVLLRSTDFGALMSEGDLRENINIAAGDIVYVPPRTMASLQREAKRIVDIMQPVLALQQVFLNIQASTLLWNSFVDVLSGKSSSTQTIIGTD